MRELRDGYGSAEAEPLIAMMRARQNQIAGAKAANAENPALPAARRLHAREAVAWATNDRDLIRRSEKLLLAAPR